MLSLYRNAKKETRSEKQVPHSSLLSLSALIHEEELAAQSIGAHLRQIAPRLIGALVHHLTESIPLSLGISRAASCRSRSRDSGELVVTGSVSVFVIGPELAVLVVITILSLDINRFYFSEVTIGVVS